MRDEQRDEHRDEQRDEQRDEHEANFGSWIFMKLFYVIGGVLT